MNKLQKRAFWDGYNTILKQAGWFGADESSKPSSLADAQKSPHLNPEMQAKSLAKSKKKTRGNIAKATGIRRGRSGLGG